MPPTKDEVPPTQSTSKVKKPDKMDILVQELRNYIDTSMANCQNQILDKIFARFDEFDLKISKMENDINSKIFDIEAKILKVDKTTNDLNVNATKSWADVVAGSSSMSKEIAKATVKEIGITESRERNIMLYNIKEIEDESEEICKSEAWKIVNLFSTECKESDMVKANRIGKKGKDKSRPIRITVKSKDLRDSIVEESTYLKDKKLDGMKVEANISPDRSADERTEIKEKLKERDDRNNDPSHPQAPKNGHKWVLAGRLHPRLKQIKWENRTKDPEVETKDAVEEK